MQLILMTSFQVIFRLDHDSVLPGLTHVMMYLRRFDQTDD